MGNQFNRRNILRNETENALVQQLRKDNLIEDSYFQSDLEIRHVPLLKQIINRQTIRLDLRFKTSYEQTNWDFLSELTLDQMRIFRLDCNNRTKLNWNQNIHANSLTKLTLRKPVYNCNLMARLKTPRLTYFEIDEYTFDRFSSIHQLQFENLLQFKITGSNLVTLKQISCISAPHLLNLSLNRNHIEDIACLLKFKFVVLNKIDLSFNRINCIDPLAKYESKTIQQLRMDQNWIRDVSILTRVNLRALQVLSLNKNRIEDAKWMIKIKLPDPIRKSISQYQQYL